MEAHGPHHLAAVLEFAPVALGHLTGLPKDPCQFHGRRQF
jgi:hypothetical protein